jgi:hypothetical protein
MPRGNSKFSPDRIADGVPQGHHAVVRYLVVSLWDTIGNAIRLEFF